jgi:O-methyltransferase
LQGSKSRLTRRTVSQPFHSLIGYKDRMHTMTKKALARLLWPHYSFSIDLLNRNAQMLGRIHDYQHSSSPAQYKNREDLYRAINSRNDDVPISYLEFGVWKGASLQQWAEINTHPDSRFYGFDSFEGFPEVWDHGFGHTTEKEHFALGGKIPQISDPRIKLIKGWFQETLADFLETNTLPHPITVHMDCDLHSSALFVLATLDSLLKPADVVIFDEFTRRPTNSLPGKNTSAHFCANLNVLP